MASVPFALEPLGKKKKALIHFSPQDIMMADEESLDQKFPVQPVTCYF